LVVFVSRMEKIGVIRMMDGTVGILLDGTEVVAIAPVHGKENEQLWDSMESVICAYDCSEAAAAPPRPPRPPRPPLPPLPPLVGAPFPPFPPFPAGGVPLAPSGRRL